MHLTISHHNTPKAAELATALTERHIGITTIHTEQPAGVLATITLPGANGRRMSFITIIDTDNASTRAAQIDAGAFDCISTPISIDELHLRLPRIHTRATHSQRNRNENKSPTSGRPCPALT